MNWFFLTILSAIFGSLTRILQKTLLKDKDSDPFAFGFVFQLLVSFLFLCYTLVTNTLEFPNLSGLLLNIFIMAIFYSLGNILTFKAFSLAEASEVSIILSSSTIWSVITATILLNEKVTTKNIIGIVSIVLGIVVINYTKKSWMVNKGHLYALAGAMLFGFAFTNDAFIVNRYSSISSYMIIAFSLPAILSLALNPKSFKKISTYTKSSVLPSLLLCSIVYALSAITIFSAYKIGGKASVISPIQQSSTILTVIFSYFLLKEKDKLPNKIIGTILTFIGVLLLI